MAERAPRDPEGWSGGGGTQNTGDFDAGNWYDTDVLKRSRALFAGNANLKSVSIPRVANHDIKVDRTSLSRYALKGASIGYTVGAVVPIPILDETLGFLLGGTTGLLYGLFREEPTRPAWYILTRLLHPIFTELTQGNTTEITSAGFTVGGVWTTQQMATLVSEIRNALRKAVDDGPDSFKLQNAFDRIKIDNGIAGHDPVLFLFDASGDNLNANGTVSNNAGVSADDSADNGKRIARAILAAIAIIYGTA